jgi:hypothetical protein
MTQSQIAELWLGPPSWSRAGASQFELCRKGEQCKSLSLILCVTSGRITQLGTQALHLEHEFSSIWDRGSKLSIASLHTGSAVL